MIRRSALVAGALLVAVLSSCSDNPASTDVVASLGDQTLTRDQLVSLTDGSADGATSRSAISQWLQVAAVGGDVDDITSMEDLQAAGQDAAADLAAPFLDEAQASYELGVDGAPVLCIGAIVVNEGNDPQDVITALGGGVSLADAAAQFGDPNSGIEDGLVTDGNGNNCLAPDGFNQALIGQLRDAGAAPGTPVVIDLGSGPAVILLRPFESLSQQEKLTVVQNDVAAEFTARLQAADITVHTRYGRWDAASGTVVALAE